MKHIHQMLCLKQSVLVGVLLVIVTGYSSANLENLNETDDPGEAMPGPGVLADEQGETPLKLETGADKKSEKSAQAIAPVTDEKTEFEQFKKWDDLRTHGAESPEYQEFLEWIKCQKFKAGQ